MFNELVAFPYSKRYAQYFDSLACSGDDNHILETFAAQRLFTLSAVCRSWCPVATYKPCPERHFPPMHLSGPAMTYGLRLISSIRSYASFNTSSLLSKNFFSSMTTTTSFALPTAEIEDLWFGGLDLQKGKPPTADAMKRWFKHDASFDKRCQFSSSTHIQLT